MKQVQSNFTTAAGARIFYREGLPTNFQHYPAWVAFLKERQPRTLILWGRNDPLFTPAALQILKETLPAARVLTFDAGHFALDEYAEEFAAAIIKTFAPDREADIPRSRHNNTGARKVRRIAMSKRLMLSVAALFAATALSAVPATAAVPAGKPTIVLVHGAFADALGYQKLIPILLRDGYRVTAVEIPLETLAGDVATTKRALEGIAGPIVLVGHSYGGAVITGAGAGESKVKALVYLAAFAPDDGEAVGKFGDKYPVDLNKALRPDSAGFLWVDRAFFRQDFAADLPPGEVAVAAATQKPLSSSVFTASVPVAAWKTIPSWYVVSKQDHAINPDLERFYAKRMKAHTTEVDASHVAFISHPAEIAKVIEQAAATVK